MSQIISFYSYKGGVGRSMALANVATLLACRGFKVLVVDFDLEAPGLHRYFLGASPRARRSRQKPTSGQQGTIDFFVELSQRISGQGETAQEVVTSLLDSGRFGYSVRVRMPATSKSATLDFWSAGNFDEAYAERVHGFPWSTFYESHAEAFTQLAEQWRKRYDYVLLDSRTGISDLGSVSTVILADKLVLAFTLNEQSLHGVTEFGRQAVSLKRNLDEASPLALFPLLSRVDEGEEKLSRHWCRTAARRFEALFAAAYGRCTIDFLTYFEAVRIPHRGYYAYGEKIAVAEEKSTILGSLAEGYARFLDCLDGKELTGWTERLRKTVQQGHEGGALVVSFETPFDPPTQFALGQVLKVPATPPPDRSRLRRVPVDPEVWERTMLEIERGVEDALSAIQGTLHVFATLPYPAAVYLGRMLDNAARTRPIQLHQFNPATLDWAPFSGAGVEPSAPGGACFQALEYPAFARQYHSVLLAIEGMRPIATRPLEVLATSLQANVHHLQTVNRRHLNPDEGPQAVKELRDILVMLKKRHPSAPLHIVTTAPVALLIELGRLLTPTVYSNAIVHQFDPRTGRYVPVLDVIQRAVLGTSMLA